MNRDTERLAAEQFDVLVVGGGIFGVATAWEAVNRGLSVALIEKHDFVHATSANCFKVIHGGVRYMQHGDIPRVRASVAERSAFLRIAPHLSSPLPIVVPTYGHGKQGKAFLRTGMAAYDALTADRNRGIRDRSRHIPHHTALNADAVTQDFSWLDEPTLTGAVLFNDAQMYSPERLGLAFVLSAAEEGACVANYVEATGFLREGDRVTGVSARDTVDGGDFDIRARCVINAAGPWAERLLGPQSDIGLKQASTFSRDAWFLLRRPWVSEYALAVQARTRDPDALLARAARHLFVVPWRDHTIVGVWHKVTDVAPDDVDVPDADLDAFIDEVNWACPALNIRLEEVGAWNAGLVLFGENTQGQENLSYGKRSRLIDHGADHGVDGLVTLIGVRYTTARGEAARALDMVEEKLGRSRTPSVTATRTLVGGAVESMHDLSREVGDYVADRVSGASDALRRSLACNYGSVWSQVVGGLSAHTLIENTHVLEAEILHACRREMAIRLEDVALRRTELADGRHPGDGALTQVASIMATELGWSNERERNEIERTDRALAYRRYRRAV